MKINILIVVLVSQIMLVSVQGSFEIKPSSVWKVDKMINVKSQKDKRCIGDETFKLFVNGDTIINAINYFKVYKSGIMYLDTIFRYSDQYYGAIRESEKKVFLIQKSKTTETLLYDFDLQVGDTIKSQIANGKMVIKIDTLEDGRKRFQITKSMLHGMDAYLIEGIGTTGGLISEPSVGHYMYNDSYLICYSENNVITYNGIDPLNSGCYLSTSRFPVNPDGIWYVNSATSCFPELVKKGDDFIKYYIEDDTLISNRVYYKIYKSGLAIYDEPFYYNRVYVGALRDDNNKFYYIGESDSGEKMLYDFDLKVGDTVTATMGTGNIIMEIDTLMDGRRKLMHRDVVCAGCCGGDDYIEGIGHWGGIMEEAPCLHPCFRGYYLLCYKENDSLIYHNDFDGMFKLGCERNNAISYVQENNSIAISPLPFKDMVTIDFSNFPNHNPLLTIYDLTGKVYFSKKLDLNGNSHFPINLSNLNSGMYIIRINSNNSCFVSKLIKE